MFGEEEGGEGAGEDVEALLLSGRASFVSLSSRLRRDAWGEVCTQGIEGDGEGSFYLPNFFLSFLFFSFLVVVHQN